MRARLALAGIAQPRSRIVFSAAHIEAAFASLTPPVVLKPADSGGQRGLFLVHTADEIRAHLPRGTRALAKRPGDPRGVPRRHRAEWPARRARWRPDGAHACRIAYARAGSASALAGSMPFRRSCRKRRSSEASDLAIAAVRALGLRDGIAFPQLIATAAGVRIIEVAARIAAGQMADLVSYADRDQPVRHRIRTGARRRGARRPRDAAVHTAGRDPLPHGQPGCAAGRNRDVDRRARRGPRRARCSRREPLLRHGRDDSTSAGRRRPQWLRDRDGCPRRRTRWSLPTKRPRSSSSPSSIWRWRRAATTPQRRYALSAALVGAALVAARSRVRSRRMAHPCAAR